MGENSAEQEQRLKKVNASAAMILDEYLLEHSGFDASVYVEELNARDLKPQLVKKILQHAMDKSVAEQHMAAALIASLCVRFSLEPPEVEAGVELLLTRRLGAGCPSGGRVCGGNDCTSSGGQDYP